MNEIVTSSKSQVAVIALDHRMVECSFYRVSSSKPGEHRSVVKVIRDAGANLNPSYFGDVAARMRTDFARKGWTYLSDGMLNRLLADGRQSQELLRQAFERSSRQSRALLGSPGIKLPA